MISVKNGMHHLVIPIKTKCEMYLEHKIQARYTPYGLDLNRQSVYFLNSLLINNKNFIEIGE